ncbi:MAG: sensor histidine kinase [Desulfobacteraceae bacterium 4572_35.2]|nr:MAG: sensor histidine kinase [Desulfobacteraceae bacterium 4572_35.2]
MNLILDLLQQMSVFLVIAYIFTKSPAFRPLTSETMHPRHKVLLYGIFSTFSIMGTYFGLPVQDAIANTRAIGPVLAGIIGGPVLGIATGLTGGIHRYFLGGFTATACGISTTTEGLIGGLVGLALLRAGKAEQRFNPWIALVTILCAEAVQMLIIVLVAKPTPDAIVLVQTIAAPMVLANAAGAALFMSIIRDQRRMYDHFGALFSAKAFELAEKVLEILGPGLDRTTAAQMAHLIHSWTGVGAVAITDREQILAFVGLGEDHHLPGTPIVSPLTQRAIEFNQTVFANGVHEHFHCSLSSKCPLSSALVVPLHIDNDVIGTIKLYEPRSKLFLNINRSLGEGLAALLSEQLVHSRYQEQKSLLTQSELKLAQAQVNPHFLFNALNTIVAVVRNDADQARDLLLHLSRFFRKNLKRASDITTLEEELDHVRSYLYIEEVRFGDRLKVEMAIDPALLLIKLPTFTLQPLIENAIKHGISQLLEHGLVTISAQQHDGGIEISIEDNAGACDQNNEDESDGLGMKIVDKRIKNLYGIAAGVRMEDSI